MGGGKFGNPKLDINDDFHECVSVSESDQAAGSGLVRCSEFLRCEHRHECGGAQPHQSDSECGVCPIDKEARCLPVDEKQEQVYREYWMGV